MLLIFITVLKYEFFFGWRGYLRFVSNFGKPRASLHCYYTVGVNLFLYMYRASFIILYSDQQMKINSQIITLLHFFLTISFHPQGDCNQRLAKLHKYSKCSCW
jgi:hypothetical protein